MLFGGPGQIGSAAQAGKSRLASRIAPLWRIAMPGINEAIDIRRRIAYRRWPTLCSITLVTRPKEAAALSH